MRLVHAADLHVDSPLRGLARLGDDALADRLRGATRRALENLVDLVVAVDADALLLAGDLYDGDWQDWATGRFVAAQLGRLHDAGVRVVTIAGNHDAESEITRSLRLPPNVTVLATDAPQTVVFDDLGLAVHGQGFATKAVTANLAAAYPARVPGVVNAGLLHSSVEGAEGHERYAPCTVADLTGLGYDYLALGHVHAREVLAEGEHAVAFAGNLQGRHPRETGPKGAWVVDVAGQGAGAALTFEALDVARWAHLRVAVDGCAGLDDVLERVHAGLSAEVAEAGERALVARVTLTGASAAAAELADAETVTEQLRADGDRLGVTVEKVRVRTRALSAADPLDDELRSAVLGAARALGDDPARLRELLRPLAAELGPAVR
ncbi:MAG: DNA double-strand break repair protein Mre16, partial [uncultured Quadrisphaera sp.]